MLADIIPSYLYVEYGDDVDLQALVAAYNALAQEYLDSINGLNLPIYTAPSITGPLLDWVGFGLYGVPRPVISGEATAAIGPYNTPLYNLLTYNGSMNAAPAPFYGASDDLYKRVITWNFYKGDGTQFTIPWIKRRVHRFINGVNGSQTTNDETYDVSVTFTSPSDILIEVPDTNPYSTILQQSQDLGILTFPIKYTVTVTPVAPPAPPINTALPVISGTPTFGSELTTTNGSWDNDPTTYTYQWTNSSTGDIFGATTNAYALQTSDVGDDITVTVTAANGVSAVPATSAAVGPVGSTPAHLLMLMHFDGANGTQVFTDESGMFTWTPTDDTCVLSSADAILGDAAGLFPTAGQGLASTWPTTGFSMAGEFTFEFRWTPPASFAGQQIIPLASQGAEVERMMIILITNGQLQWYAGISGDSDTRYGFPDLTFTAGVPAAIMISRDADNVIRGFVNGVVSTTTYTDGWDWTQNIGDPSCPFWLGSYFPPIGGGQPATGVIDELRISDLCLATADYTVDTSEFPTATPVPY
jgi:hypothetical protein